MTATQKLTSSQKPSSFEQTVEEHLFKNFKGAITFDSEATCTYEADPSIEAQDKIEFIEQKGAYFVYFNNHQLGKNMYACESTLEKARKVLLKEVSESYGDNFAGVADFVAFIESQNSKASATIESVNNAEVMKEVNETPAYLAEMDYAEKTGLENVVAYCLLYEDEKAICIDSDGDLEVYKNNSSYCNMGVEEFLDDYNEKYGAEVTVEILMLHAKDGVEQATVITRDPHNYNYSFEELEGIEERLLLLKQSQEEDDYRQKIQREREDRIVDERERQRSY